MRNAAAGAARITRATLLTLAIIRHTRATTAAMAALKQVITHRVARTTRVVTCATGSIVVALVCGARRRRTSPGIRAMGTALRMLRPTQAMATRATLDLAVRAVQAARRARPAPA